MSEATTNETNTHTEAPGGSPDGVGRDSRQDSDRAARRALLVADEGADAEALRAKLAAAGFEAADASAEEAAARAKELSPAAVLLAFGGREGEARLLSLARRLRAEPSSFALPVVLLFREDTRALRSAARHLGADDYFPQDATTEELRARLEALLWRAESGRRGAPAVADQRSEIDNFLFLLDAVGADARRGLTGSLALVEAEGGDASLERGGDGSRAAAPRALTDAHGFLKLNLRRVDAVAFYGPATLLVYLPGAGGASARATLSRLREEFAGAYAGADLYAGVSSFPAHGSEVERLVEQAEAALGEARGANSAARVVVYGFAEAAPADADAERRAAPPARRATMKETPDGREVVASNETSNEVSAVSAREASARGPAAAAQTFGRGAGGRARRVMLVVSDEARMARVNLLMRSAAYEVRAAFDGQHALNLLRIDRPDALVVDYELRDMDGVEMLGRLEKQPRAGRVPALLLLPPGRESVRAGALDAGASAVVEMPYDAVELLDTLRELCETE